MPSNRREAARRILSDPDARRKLMVKTIQATQAREGIETSEAQAEKAYYVVTEADQGAFFDLAIRKGSKNQADQHEQMFVRALQTEENDKLVRVSRRDFSVIDGAPLLYSQVGMISSFFRDYPRLGRGWAHVRGGMNSTASDRFVRHFWEVSSSKTKTWVKYSKGGVFSRFYSDLELVFDWTDDGKEFRALVKRLYGSESRFVKSPGFYFKRGLTWTEKSSLGLSVRVLEEGAIFNVAGPGAFPIKTSDEWYLLGVLNSALIAFVAWSISGRNYGADYISSLPVPQPTKDQMKLIGYIAQTIYEKKKSWDTGNEISTKFVKPWLLREDIIDVNSSLEARLDKLAAYETEEVQEIRRLHSNLNDEVNKIYGVTGRERSGSEYKLKHQPDEVIWKELEKSDADQKRMEHVWRLLSYFVKRVVAEDEDGIVPFASTSEEPSLLERIHDKIEQLFPHQAGTQTEAQIVNELKRRVKGYRRLESIAAWLEDAFFDYHVSLYERRPVIWHVASCPTGEGAAAFGALIDYHRFDRNNMAKLRGTYLRDHINHLRREAALASQEGRREDQIELQAKLEEATALDERLRHVQEGRHEGEEGDERDFRILTPWKSPQQRPVGWNPDIDDGVKVNIEPLQKAGVLRIAKVI